jgi:terminase small subunit-like protein
MQTKNPPKCGRSPGYNAEIAKAICNRLVNGESLRAICADPAMPAKATVCRWLAGNKEFRRWYVIARECQAEDFAGAILEIADGCGDLRHARRRIGVLKLAAGRMAPRKYGKR